MYANSIKSHSDAYKKLIRKGDIPISKAMKIAEDVDRYREMEEANNPVTFKTNRSRDNSNKKYNSRQTNNSETNQGLMNKIPKDPDVEKLTNDFAKMKINVCHRCGQPGHIARFCQNEISPYNINLLNQFNKSF